MVLSTTSQLEDSRTIEGGGMQWIVREAFWMNPGGQARPCLIFENDAVVRRVRVYPSNWRTCPEAALYALSLVF
jgi:hypothetical protein